MKNRNVATIISALVFLASIFLSARFILFNQLNSVNLLFFDQWELYEQFINNPSLLDLFRFQFGPHRQGLGYIITYFLALTSHWNIKTETFAMSLIQLLTCLTFLLIKKKLFKRYQLSDIIIPISVLGIKYYESFVVVPNMSLAVLPIFFLSIASLLLTLKTPIRFPLLGTLAFFMMFSGFGFTIVPFLLYILLIELTHTKRKTQSTISIILAITIIVSGITSFLIGYRYDPSVNCVVNPAVDYSTYPYFIGSIIINYFFTISSTTHTLAPIGFILYLVLAFFLTRKMFIIARSPFDCTQIHQTQILFIGVSVLFCLLSAIGRSCLGANAGEAPRYLLYILPAIIGLYFEILNSKNGTFKNTILVCIVTITIICELLSASRISQNAYDYKTVKESWLTCYLKFESVHSCEKEAPFRTMPEYMEQRAETILQFTKVNHYLIYQNQH